LRFESFTTIKGIAIYKNIHQKLLQWYKKEGRHDLPWRNTDEVYYVYLSETMLQQTQVSRVQEHYYPLFIEKYPTLRKLADASLDEVLANWSGLGYYSRARNLHKSATLCKSGLPDTQKELLKLPGIGRYTASAICSFGYDQCVSVVDTNIKRVLVRFFGLYVAKENEVWQKADGFLNRLHPKHHNLALMDLGATICSPKNPKCTQCPLQSECIGKENPQLYTQTKKTKYEDLELFLGVNLKADKLALVKSTQRLYNGLLTLPHVDPIDEDFIGSFKHGYTKYKITVNLYKTEIYDESFEWIDYKNIDESPVSSMVKKAVKLL